MQKHGESIVKVTVHPEGYMILGTKNYTLVVETTLELDQKVYKAII